MSKYTRPRVTRSPGTIQLPERRDLTTKEIGYLKNRLKRCKMWEEFEQKRILKFDCLYPHYPRQKAILISWRETVSDFADRLTTAERLMEEAGLKEDYPFMGNPEDWHQASVDKVLSKLVKQDEKDDKPSENWSYWDDCQWVYKRMNVNTLKPGDFPTISAYNLMFKIRSDDKGRVEFEKWYADQSMKVELAKMKAAAGEADPGDGVPDDADDVPATETPEHQAFRDLIDFMKNTAEAKKAE